MTQQTLSQQIWQLTRKSDEKTQSASSTKLTGEAVKPFNELRGKLFLSFKINATKFGFEQSQTLLC